MNGSLLKTLKEQAMETKQTADIRPGAILHSSWGYDQTNIDYYQVTRVTASTVWLRPIAKETDDTRPSGDMARYVKPCPGRFTGPEFRRKLKNGYVKICSFEYAYPADCPSYHETNYA